MIRSASRRWRRRWPSTPSRRSSTSIRARSSRAPLFTGLYLRAYDSVAEARTSIGRYLDFYNGRRPHSSHVWPQGHHFDGCSAGRHRPAPELKPVTQGLPQRTSLTYSPRVVTTGEKRGSERHESERLRDVRTSDMRGEPRRITENAKPGPMGGHLEGLHHMLFVSPTIEVGALYDRPVS